MPAVEAGLARWKQDTGGSDEDYARETDVCALINFNEIGHTPRYVNENSSPCMPNSAKTLAGCDTFCSTISKAAFESLFLIGPGNGKRWSLENFDGPADELIAKIAE